MRAIVPIAFFAPEHVEMTDAFLSALCPEVEAVRVYLNEDGFDGGKMLAGHDVEVIDAEGWAFYRMWNEGIAWARPGLCLVVNNDITWPAGALSLLGDTLAAMPSDVALCSPDPDARSIRPGIPVDVPPAPAYRGLLGWCFVIRSEMAAKLGRIDERYHTWYGDDELGRLVMRAGYRCVRAVGVPVSHPQAETTTRHIPDVAKLRAADEVLYRSKWG